MMKQRRSMMKQCRSMMKIKNAIRAYTSKPYEREGSNAERDKTGSPQLDIRAVCVTRKSHTPAGRPARSAALVASPSRTQHDADREEI
ncbi:MAG: hypothetical protein ABI612_12340 [Betaproteobacteria bacterium]